jgi:5'-nucleotidase
MPIAVTRLGRRIYGKEIPSGIDPRGQAYYWLAGDEPRGIPEEGTDIAAIKAKQVSVTPLAIDSTYQPFLPELTAWKF